MIQIGSNPNPTPKSKLCTEHCTVTFSLNHRNFFQPRRSDDKFFQTAPSKNQRASLRKTTQNCRRLSAVSKSTAEMFVFLAIFGKKKCQTRGAHPHHAPFLMQ